MNTSSPPTQTQPGQTRLWAFLQLVRLPNVFTAIADIALSALVVYGLPDHSVRLLPFVMLVLASCCLYCSGMVWNDYFDADKDERERPFRPIPSGRVSLNEAFTFATLLMCAGVGLAVAVDFQTPGFRGTSTLMAVLLCGSILLYSGPFKPTLAAPFIMGVCRGLNIMLGLTVSASWVGEWSFVLALVTTLYIAGVTLFARREAQTSDKVQLGWGMAVLLFGILQAIAIPALVRENIDPAGTWRQTVPVMLGHLFFPYLMVGFAVYVGWPMWTAFQLPNAKNVQAAVKRCVFGLVILDAILATAFVGPLGLLLVLLLVPGWYFGKRMYST